MKLGSELKRLRLERGYTQQQLGDMIGVQKSAIQKYEKGTVKNLKQETISKLCRIFDVSPAVFLDDLYDTDQLSREVRLLEELSILFGNQAVDILESYHKLNQQGKAKLQTYARDISEIEKYTKG